MPTLLSLSLMQGGRQQGGVGSFPGCRQGWEPSPRPLGWVGPARGTSLLGGGQEVVQTHRALLPLSFPAGGSPAYSDTALGVEGTALSSAVLAGKKTEGFLDSIASLYHFSFI